VLCLCGLDSPPPERYSLSLQDLFRSRVADHVQRVAVNGIRHARASGALSGRARDESGAHPVAQQPGGVRGRVRLAELPAQDIAQLAEWPAVACGIERRRLAGVEGAGVGGVVWMPATTLDGCSIAVRLYSP